MKHRVRFVRTVLSLALLAVMGFGLQAFVPPVFADCGTNSAGGNCKQATPEPNVPGGLFVARTLFEMIRVFWP